MSDTLNKSDIKPSLTIKRRFNAPRAKVYAAWTDPEKIKRWMGPGEIKTVHAETDLRSGGRYSIMMLTPAGESHDVGGVYREVIANERLVYTWSWKSTPERESLVTVTFKDDDGGTLLTLLHEQFFDEAARDSHNGGWNRRARQAGNISRLNRRSAMSHGKFVWNELMTHDLAKAKKFYGEVMGWTFDAMPGPNGGSY